MERSLRDQKISVGEKGKSKVRKLKPKTAGPAADATGGEQIEGAPAATKERGPRRRTRRTTRKQSPIITVTDTFQTPHVPALRLDELNKPVPAGEGDDDSDEWYYTDEDGEEEDEDDDEEDARDEGGGGAWEDLGRRD